MRDMLLLCSLLLLPLIAFPASPDDDTPIMGRWVMLRDMSTDIDHLRALSLELRKDRDGVTLVRTWGGGRHQIHDSISARPGGPPVILPVIGWAFASNVFMGVQLQEGDPRRSSARR